MVFRSVHRALAPVARQIAERHRTLLSWFAILTSIVSLVACGIPTGATATPAAPTPVVIVVTATPDGASAAGPSAPATASKPAPEAPVAGPTARAASPVAASRPAPIASSPAASGQATGGQTNPTAALGPLAVGRSISYRGLTFTVEEARSGAEIDDQRAPRGKSLIGLRLRVQNSGGKKLDFVGGDYLNKRLRLLTPDGADPTAEAVKPFIAPIIGPSEVVAGWLYFVVDRPSDLETLALELGGADEATVKLPFTGPEPPSTTRTFEYHRSTQEVRGLLWSVSGGEIRLDVPGQQASPGQEFVVLKVRATNPSAEIIRIRDNRQRPQRGPDYLRMKADNGVLLQVSAELNPLPTEFPGKAEQDTLYAWQLPRGSRNPSLVIVSPDESQHALELGPLPPPTP